MTLGTPRSTRSAWRTRAYAVAIDDRPRFEIAAGNCKAYEHGRVEIAIGRVSRAQRVTATRAKRGPRGDRDQAAICAKGRRTRSYSLRLPRLYKAALIYATRLRKSRTFAADA